MKFFLSVLAFMLGWHHVQAKVVFAHFMVTNSQNYTSADWKDDMTQAMDAHIDAFALNMAYADPTNEPALAMAFPVAEALGFRLFFSFDYAGGGPWDMQDVISLIRQYSSSSSYWYYNGQPFVSTFEGPGNSKDWVTIKKDTNCFFIPDWSSLGAKAALELKAADGLFNWAAWPWGNENMNTYVDASYFQYLEAAGDLPYMMPVSPWFYTNLPGYDKNWMWRGDDLWHDRWVEVWYTQPEFVEIISWNDYGESHYIGPLRPDAMAAFDIGKAPFNYAANMPHDAWRLFLPYYIDTYKNNISEIQQEGLVSWYRLEPAAACPSGGTSGNTASQLQLEFEPKDIAQDMIFYSALLTSPAEVTVTIDGQTQSGTWEWAPNSQIGGVGVYHGSVPFNGLLGEVTITLSRGGETIMSIEGPAITDTCPHGIANWNAWVGGDTGPVVSAKPSLKLNEQECIAGTGAYNFEGLCSFACEYGYCPIGACTCQQQGAPKKKPTATSVTGYPLAGEDASYSGLCSFDCTYGYCPDTACGTTSAPLSIPTVSDFLPPTCVGGTGSGEFEGLCSFSCHYGYCPIDLCTCTEQGALILAPSSTSYYGVAMATSTTPPSLAFQGLCSFACGHGYCPKGACYEAVIDIETDDNVSLAGFNCKNPVENVTSNQILEQYVEWGTAYIDEWFQKNKDHTTWLGQMTELFDDASCVSFPSGGDCEPPSPSQCSWPANPPMDPGLFQAQLMGVAYYGVLNQWRQAFDSAGSLAALQIGTITDAFPSKSPQVIPLAQLLSTLGAAFGAAGSALSIIPDGEFAGGATGIIGGILSTIGGALPSSDPSDNTQNTLSNYMSLLYTSTWTAIDTMANNIFKKGDVSSFPKSVITGPWTTPMANYFYNGKWFYPMDTSTTEDLGYTMNRTIQQGLVGATLGAADYFILAVTVSESDCDQITSGTIIDGLCYFLAFPGSQECNKDNNAIDSDTVKTMATYGVKPSDVIENSVACQKQTDNYFGTLPLAFTPESWGTGNPICFYNLPVFKVQVGLTLTATEAVEENPCDVYKSNLTATSPVTGLTWLPPNLASIFNDDWCYCVRPCPPYC